MNYVPRWPWESVISCVGPLTRGVFGLVQPRSHPRRYAHQEPWQRTQASTQNVLFPADEHSQERSHRFEV